MEDVFEAGAEDFHFGEEVIEITTAPNDLRAVREFLEGKGYQFVSAEVEYLPVTTTALTDPEDLKKMTNLLDAMDDDDDVQDFWTTLENEEDLDR